MPAATCSGVTPSSVAIFGSAPRASSSFISSMSPDCDARRNAVAPFSSSHWLVKTVRVSVLSFTRALTLAPLSMQQLDELQVIHVALADGIVAVLDVAVVGGQVQRHPAALVGQVRIGAVLEQIRAELVVAVLRRHQQRAPAVAGRLVDVGAGCEQHLHRLEVVGARRIDERRQLLRRPPAPAAAAAASASRGIVRQRRWSACRRRRHRPASAAAAGRHARVRRGRHRPPPPPPS